MNYYFAKIRIFFISHNEKINFFEKKAPKVMHPIHQPHTQLINSPMSSDMGSTIESEIKNDPMTQ